MEGGQAAAEDARVKIKKLSLGPLGTNAYIVECRQSGESVLVDAPADPDSILQALQGTIPKYILLTHSHQDHIGALEELRSPDFPAAAHADESARLSSPANLLLNDGDELEFGKVKIEVLHTPGHTSGSLCFKMGSFLMSGDTIFAGGPGKTWSPAGFQQIVRSITTKIFVLPDETRIFPGHGESTLLRKEKEEYEVFASRSHDPDLCGDVVWLSS